jgi:hypothetical protein
VGFISSIRTFRAWRQAVHDERGYRISYKQLSLAFLAEGFVIAASLYGAYLFAIQYGHNDTEFRMMLLAPIGYAVIELARVPLALAVRTQRSVLMRSVALIGVLCAAGVTVKSMSQLGEIMFRPRLFEVVEAKQKLDQAKNDAASVNLKITDADAIVAQRKSEFDASEARVKSVNEQIGGLAPPSCAVTRSVDKRGNRRQGQVCKDDPRGPVLTASLAQASADRVAAASALDTARGERNGLSRQDADRSVSSAELTHRQAVMHSQLHSFTAMAFGKDPTEVTDGEIHTFLRIFVFLPAIFVAFASTLLAMTAVTRLKPKTVEIEDGVLESFIDPYARELIERAAAQSERRVLEILERRARVPEPVVVPAAPVPAEADAEAAAHPEDETLVATLPLSRAPHAASVEKEASFVLPPGGEEPSQPVVKVDQRRAADHPAPPLKIVKGD